MLHILGGRRAAEKKASGDEGMAATAMKMLENTQSLVMELAEDKPLVLAAAAGNSGAAHARHTPRNVVRNVASHLSLAHTSAARATNQMRPLHQCKSVLCRKSTSLMQRSHHCLPHHCVHPCPRVHTRGRREFVRVAAWFHLDVLNKRK